MERRISPPFSGRFFDLPRFLMPLSHSALKLWVFDLDGTLIDSRYDLVSAVNATLVWRDLKPLAEETIVSYIGDGADDLIRRSLESAGMPAPVIREDFAGTMRWFLDYYGEHCLDRTVPYPGARELLDALAARGIPMAVLTNKPEKPAFTILRHLGWFDLFTHVIPGDGPLGKKPDPRGLAAILNGVAVEPQESVLVGDSLQDARTARAAGTAFVLFRGGLGDVPAIMAESPDAAIDTLPELLDLIRAAHEATP
jgi:phosphoglycolate phosphatase